MELSHWYEINHQNLLGVGKFGKVYEGFHKRTNKAVAIKKIMSTSNQMPKEIIIMMRLYHPGIVILLRTFMTEEHVYIVMEKLSRDLLKLVKDQKRLKENTAKFIITQILVGLKYLHSNHIVHGDIKLENILLSSNTDYPQVKLCDFGSARVMPDNELCHGYNRFGTPVYLAPEVYTNKGFNKSIDLWSLGVVTYVSLTGMHLFKSDYNVYGQILKLNQLLGATLWKGASLYAIEFVENLLDVNPITRMTLDLSLINPWLYDFDNWLRLRKLENAVGKRYLTNINDDARWGRVAAHLDRKRNNNALRISSASV